MPIDSVSDGDTSWGNEIRAVIAAVNALEGVTAANLPETIRDTVAGTVVGTGLVTVTPNDAADTVTVSTSATANSSDATLLNRGNHTSTQVAATISDLAEAIDDRVAALLTAGANISLTYNDTAGTLTIAGSGAGGGGSYTDEQVRDVIGATLVAGSNVTVSVDDTANTITISSSGGGGGSYTDEQVRDVIVAALRAGPNVTITSDDTADTITIGSTGGGGGTGGVATYARGINAAGGEFAAAASTLPGTYNTDYSYDSAGAFATLAGRGHSIVRLPFRWERLQPTRGAALNSAELTRLQQVVSDIKDAGMTCVLDMHNYARYINSTANGGAELVLGTGLPAADLVDVWTRISTAFNNNAGVYAYGLMNEPHDIAAVSGTFSGTTRYDWNDATVQGFTGDGASVSNVGSKLRFALTPGGSGFYQTRKDDAGTKRGGSLTGDTLRAVVTLASGTPGTWSVLLQWLNTSFQWQTAPSTVYTRVDTGAVVSGLVAGVAVAVQATFASNIPTSVGAFAVQIESNNPTAGTYSADVDDFAQGTNASGQTPAQVWETTTQQLVTAIRNNNDTTKIMVPGYNYSGAQVWASTHPDPWIVDPADNHAYEAHYYWDIDNSGDYPDSYATENAAAIAAGFTSVANRATTQLSSWLTWLDSYSVGGFLGEFGWPNTGDTTSWNAVGEAVYDLLDTHLVEAAYWATGARWGSGYILSAYTGTTLSVVKSQAATIEAHPTLEVEDSAALAALEARVDALEAGGGGGGGGPATHDSPHLGPAFMVIGANTPSSLATSAANGSTHGLVEVIWDQVQSSAGGPVNASGVIAAINNVRAAGLKVCVRVSPQYPPAFVQSNVPKFKQQGTTGANGTEYTAATDSGNNVRDWVFSGTGREYLRDFLEKLFSQLDWSLIERVQLGGLVAGELAYPVNNGSTPDWWGYSAPAQSGTDLAPRMARCPLPAHIPSSGTTWTDNDAIWVTWYHQSLINFMTWLVEQHREWFSGPIWVLHPSSGLRKVSQTPTGSAALNYRLEASRGTDWEWQIGAYPDPDVHPYCTWADAQHFVTSAPYNDVNDANAAPWYHLLRLARRAGRAARIWGENTVVNSPNATMDRCFKEGAVPFGYEGFVWLNHTSLALGTDDTYANWAARIAEVKVPGGDSTYPPYGSGPGGSGGGLDSEAVRDVVGLTVVGSGLISATYNDAAGTHTIATSATAWDAEQTRDTMATALVAGTNVTITPNDGADTITIAATGAASGVTSTAATSYTLVLGDAGKVVETTSGSPVTVTVPPNSSVAYPVGSLLDLTQRGVGALTVAAGSGVTILTAGSYTAAKRNVTLRLRKHATNEWVLAGETALGPTDPPLYRGLGPKEVDLSTVGTVRTATSVATIQSQITASVAGDTVQITAGSYGAVTTSKSISSGFIRIVPVTAGTVSIAGVTLTNSQGLDWRGINTTGEVYYSTTTRCRWRGGTSTPGSSLTGHNIRESCNDVVVEDATITNPDCSFFLYADRDTLASNNITIQRCRSNNVAQDHVFIGRGTNVLIQDNEFFGNTEDPEHSDGVQLVGGKVVTIRRNHIACSRAFRDGASDRNDHGIICNYDPSEVGGGSTAGRKPENIIIESNLIHDQTSHGITIAGCLGITIRNNTVYDNGLNGTELALSIAPDAGNTISNLVVVNNIFNKWSQSGVTATTNSNNFVADNSGPSGTNKLSGTVGFVDNTALNYRLTSGSQNVTSGAVGGAAATDLFNYPTSAAPSRGAIEGP